MYSKNVIVAMLQASSALAATHNVNVGGNKQLIFTPTSVKAAAGDTVRFTFLDQNHTATAGSPSAGCQPANPVQFNSGFVPVAANATTKPTFDVAVTNALPMTVYCGQAAHCQSGMVMVINPAPVGASSLVGYQRLTSQAKTNTPAKGGVVGGLLRNAQTSGTGAAAAGAAKTGKGKGGRRFRPLFHLFNAVPSQSLTTSVISASATPVSTVAAVPASSVAASCAAAAVAAPAGSAGNSTVAAAKKGKGRKHGKSAKMVKMA